MERTRQTVVPFSGAAWEIYWVFTFVCSRARTAAVLPQRLHVPKYHVNCHTGFRLENLNLKKAQVALLTFRCEFENRDTGTAELAGGGGYARTWRKTRKTTSESVTAG